MDECVRSIQIEESHCLPACEGVLVTSYTKSNTNMRLEDVIGDVLEEYDLYKGKIEYPSGLRGKFMLSRLI